MKNIPVGTELFHVEGRTDRQTKKRRAHMTKLIVVFAILRTCQKFYFSPRELLTQIKGNYITKCDSFKVHKFFEGQPL